MEPYKLCKQAVANQPYTCFRLISYVCCSRLLSSHDRCRALWEPVEGTFCHTLNLLARIMQLLTRICTIMQLQGRQVSYATLRIENDQ